MGGKGYAHKIQRFESFGFVFYRLSWCYDAKVGRLRAPRIITRDTDEEGAQRFAKKWGIAMPEEDKGL